MTPTTKGPSPAGPWPPDGAPLSGRSDAELREEAAEAGRQMAAWSGRLVVVSAELDRRAAWRADGATCLESWLGAHCGVSAASARALAHVGERLVDLPRLRAGLVGGALSFDQVRTLVDAASPRNEAELCAQAKDCSVRELAELARSVQGPPPASAAAFAYERRALRFNDTLCTMSAQLEADTYAEVRAGLEARAKALGAPAPSGGGPDDGAGAATGSDDGSQDATPVRFDQRLADALVALVRAGGEASGRPPRRRAKPGAPAPSAPSPYLVVAHVPLATLADPGAPLAGELEHHGLVGPDTVRRLACDGAVVVAVDDDVGHTMYEGRARRDPSGAQRRELWRRDRHCRFPGCGHATFTHPHHLVPWHPEGRTDLDNLVLLCEHHHRRMHARAWSVRGDANGELTFVGPSGRAMTSRPSPLWTRVTGARARGTSGPAGQSGR